MAVGVMTRGVIGPIFPMLAFQHPAADMRALTTRPRLAHHPTNDLPASAPAGAVTKGGYDTITCRIAKPNHAGQDFTEGWGWGSDFDVSGNADPNPFPALVVGATLDQPGRTLGANAITVLTDVRSRGHQAGWMAGNRAYNNSVPAEFQIPPAALGYRAVFDYKADQRGIQDQTQGRSRSKGPGTARRCRSR